jgi:hypothetical protein
VSSGVRSELNNVKRKLQFLLQRIHKDSGDSKALKAIGDSTDACFKEMHPIWSKIMGVIGQDHPEKFHHHWKMTVSDVVFLAALKHWLQTGALLSKDESTALLMGSAAAATNSGGGESKGDGKTAAASGSSKLAVDLEDYLHGVASLPKELVLC